MRADTLERSSSRVAALPKEIMESYSDFYVREIGIIENVHVRENQQGDLL